VSVAYDPRRLDVIADPFPVYRQLQDEDPAHVSPVLKGRVITRYEDVRTVLTDPRFSADRITPFADHLAGPARERLRELLELLGLWAVFLDPPRHTAVRRLMMTAFTSRAVDTLRPHIQAIVDRLLDDIAERGTADLIREFAYPLPATVIAHLLGVPLDRLDDLKRWSDELAAFVGSALTTPDKLERAQRGMVGLAGFFRELIAARRRQPRDDLLSALVGAEERGDLASEDALVANAILLLFAGHETTTNLIGNGLHWLLRNPGEYRRLRASPALVPSAVEEMLRYDGPSAAVVRVAGEPVALAGAALAPGERVFAMITAANRDPRQFPAADRFDVGREPNRHLAFGQGIHFCLGAPLARLEGQVAIEAIVRRLPDLALVDERGRWNDSLVLRGLVALPLAFRPSPRLVR
jgi:cytochrome P450